MFEFLSPSSKNNKVADGSSSMNSSRTILPPDQESQAPKSDFGSPPGTPNTLVQVPSQTTQHELPVAADDEYEENNAEQYRRYSPARKMVIVAVISYCSFLAPISSTAILAGVPEVAKTFQTTGDVINASNAVYLIFMGISALFWGPVSQVWGRRPIFIISGVLLCVFTVATALSPNLATYFVFRALTAFQGTSFLVVGSSAIGDIYEPRARASAMGWFVSGSLIGPAFGPFLGGVVVTFQPWRTVFWLLTAMTGLAALLIIFCFPETIPYKSEGELAGQTLPRKSKMVWDRISPFRVLALYFKYPNLFLTGLTSGALVWNQYALLTPIRYVLNPRFHLETPIQSGFFYLAPGAGYLAGTFVGGRWADHTVRKYISQRNGQRIPEDRLRSCLPHLYFVIPGCLLVYGWTIDQSVGGIPVPVIAMFLQGVSQLFCFPSLNTYCLDVMQAQGRSAEVVAGNYVFRYIFAALGTGVVLPAIQAMGAGWFNTISAAFLVVTGVVVWLTVVYGPKWREGVDAKNEKNISDDSD